MPRNTPALPSHTTPLHGQMPAGGNGHALDPELAAELDRFDRIESLLASIQHELEVQFRRIAALPVQFDRALASDRLKPQP